MRVTPRTYGYLKTNADVKGLIPQIDALKSHGVADRDLYSDPAASGKGRPGLEALLGKLGRGDVLVVPSIAALGSLLDLKSLEPTVWRALRDVANGGHVQLPVEE